MKNIGVFCSDNSVFCVERAASNKFGKMFVVEGQEDASRRQGPTTISITPDVLSHFSQEFEKHGFKSNQVNLALPSRDIIFRSFIIPWMPAHEIKNVVDYEIDKYLPFDKNELKYSFHDIKFVQDNTRKIRIVFIGIKKLSLSQYVERFKQIGLEVKLVEPGDISLIQTLASFGEISANETVTLVKKNRDRGKLMIIDQGVPLFVREFSFSAMDSEVSAMITRMTNEVRISMDYFTRQDQQFSCKKILFLNAGQEPAISSALQENLGLPVKVVDLARMFPNQQVDNIEYLNAFGIGLKNSFGLSVDFNSMVDEVQAKDVPLDPEEEKRKNLVSTVLVGCVSLVLIVVGFLIPGILTKSHVDQLSQVKAQMESIQHKQTSDLEFERNFLKEKLDKFQGTRLKSDIAYFVQAIPEFMPKGVWLSDFDVAYRGDAASADGVPVKGQMELTLSGFCYTGDPAAQFRQVNAFLGRLKNEKQFAAYFQTIELNSMTTENIEGYQVAGFRITCR